MSALNFDVSIDPLPSGSVPRPVHYTVRVFVQFPRSALSSRAGGGGGTSWTVRRRYSDFVALKAQLDSLSSACFGKGLVRPTPPLPPKTGGPSYGFLQGFVLTTSGRAKLGERRKGLQQWLSSVLDGHERQEQHSIAYGLKDWSSEAHEGGKVDKQFALDLCAAAALTGDALAKTLPRASKPPGDFPCVLARHLDSTGHGISAGRTALTLSAPTDLLREAWMSACAAPWMPQAELHRRLATRRAALNDGHTSQVLMLS
jgi:hypothetical protein